LLYFILEQRCDKFFIFRDKFYEDASIWPIFKILGEQKYFLTSKYYYISYFIITKTSCSYKACAVLKQPYHLMIYYYLRMKGETLGMNTETKIRCLNLFHPIPRKMEEEESECWRKVCQAISGFCKDQKEKWDCWTKAEET
jgi:hypothetical protein